MMTHFHYSASEKHDFEPADKFVRNNTRLP